MIKQTRELEDDLDNDIKDSKSLLNRIKLKKISEQDISSPEEIPGFDPNMRSRPVTAQRSKNNSRPPTAKSRPQTAKSRPRTAQSRGKISERSKSNDRVSFQEVDVEKNYGEVLKLEETNSRPASRISRPPTASGRPGTAKSLTSAV